MSAEFVQKVVFRISTEGGGELTKLEGGIKKAEDAARKLGQQKDPIKALSPEFQRLAQLSERLGETYQRTGTYGRTSIAAVAAQLKEVQREHGATAASARNLSDAERALWARTSGDITQAIAKQREFNEQQRRVAAATHEWTGFHSALQAVGGRFSQITQVVGGVFAAFTAGISIGRGVDKWLEENISHWKKWRDSVADSIVSAFSGASKGTAPTARVQQLAGIVGLRQAGAESIKKLYEDLQRNAIPTIDAAVDGVKKFREGLVLLAREGATGTGKFLRDSKSDLQGYVDAFASAGIALPKDIKKITDSLGILSYKQQEALKNLKQLLPQLGIRQNIPFTTTSNTAANVTDQMAAIAEARSKSQFEEWLNKERDLLDDFIADWKFSQDEAARRFANQFNAKIRTDLDSLITGFLGGGSKGLLGSLETIFQRYFGEGSQSLGDLLINGIGKMFPGSVKPGVPGVNGGSPQLEPFSAGANALQGAMGFGAIAINANQSSKPGGGGSLLGSTISGALAGAALGSVIPVLGTAIGAIVGAVVGFVASLLASSPGSTYKYGIPTIKKGKAGFGDTQNFGTTENLVMVGRIQDQYDTFRNAFVKIMLTFPEAVITKLKDIDGKFQGAASKSFMTNFDNWLNKTLPQAIAVQFYQSMEDAFVGRGFSKERFAQIFDRLSALDPKKALELYTQLAQGVVNVSDAMAGFGKHAGFDVNIPGTGSILGVVKTRQQQTFGQSLATTDDRIQRLAESLSLLAGEEQIRAYAQLGEMMKERNRLEEEFVQKVSDMIRDVNLEIDSSIRGLKMEGLATNPQGQVDFLTGYMHDLQAQLKVASTPEEVRRIQQELLNTILSVKTVGASMGPDAEKAYRDWAIAALEELRNATLGRLANLGNELDSVNQQFIAQVQPLLDTFMKTLEVFGDAIKSVGGGGSGDGPLPFFEAATVSATDGLNGFTDALHDAAGALFDSGFVDGVRRSRGGG